MPKKTGIVHKAAFELKSIAKKWCAIRRLKRSGETAVLRKEPLFKARSRRAMPVAAASIESCGNIAHPFPPIRVRASTYSPFRQ
jgi:hypothetical protein